MAVQISGNDITVPRDGTFSRNVSIAGTLTYEDVTNVDSIGLVTARNGIEVGASPGVAASISVDGNMIVSGISTFGGKVLPSSDSSIDIGTTSVRFQNAYVDNYYGSGANLTGISQVGGATGVDFNDDTKARFGTGNDLEIWHSSNNNSYIKNSTGELKLASDNIALMKTDQSETFIDCIGDGAVELYHDNTKQCETSANGLAFPSGKGIDFSATGGPTNGTGTSELLDDYEEGTFTPEFNSGSAASACYAAGVSYSSQVGVYRKVGNVVHFIVKIQVSSGTLKSGLLQILNLPFTSGDFSSYSIVGGAFLSYTTGYFSDTANIPTIFISPGGTALQFYNTAGNNFAGSHLAQAAGRLDINGHYFTS